MAYWLFKSEPFKWSWDMQKNKGAEGEQWDGVRNYQARNNMRAMKIGDKGFFYHSNEGLKILAGVDNFGKIFNSPPRWTKKHSFSKTRLRLLVSTSPR